MAEGTTPHPLQAWSAVSLAGLTTVAAVHDGSMGSGWFVSSPVAVLLAAGTGAVLGAWTPHRLAAAGVLAAAASLTYANQRHFAHEYPVADDFAFYLIAIGGPALLGAMLVARIRQVRELDDLRRRRAAQRSDDIAAARLREQQRIEIAVHHRLVERLGAVALRAEGAGSESDASARDALAEIEETSRAGLDELRQALGVLREEPEAQVVPSRTSPPGVQPPAGRGDVLLVAGLAAAMAVESVVSSTSRGPAWANAVLAFVVTAPLLERRRQPLLALAGLVSLGAAYSAVLTPVPAMVTPIAQFVVIAYAVGAYARSWWRLVGTVMLWLGYVLLLVVSPPGTQDPDGLLPTLVWSVLAVSAGMASASWSDRAAQMGELVAELERLRDADLRLAVAQQRRLVARDLHDTVAHALSVVCLNAGAAQSTDTSARGALTTIADAARIGIAELRRGLHALEPPERLDAPSVRLIAQRLGIDLNLEVPVSDDITAADTALLLRVLRESLVNVARHASGAHVDAVVTTDDIAVRIEVIDSGPALGRSETFWHRAGAELGAGVGLSGLDALVREHGGSLEFGPLPERGFRVAASLPPTVVDDEPIRRQLRRIRWTPVRAVR